MTVQFRDTKDLLFEDVYACHRFTFDVDRQFESFKRAATYFVGYLVHYKTVDRMFVQYRVHWLTFVSRVLRKHGHEHATVDEKMTADQFAALTLPDLYERLRLDAHTFTPADSYKNVWGNRYWEFLHAASLCVDGDVTLTRAFANLMLNFHLVLVCGACYNSYKKKDPLRTVTVPMRETLDPVTVLFNLHNNVNAEIGNRPFSIWQFCDRYDCTVIDEYTRSYKTIISY